MAIKRFQKGSGKHPQSNPNRGTTGGQLKARKKGSNQPSIDPQSTPNKEVEIEVPPWRCPICDLLPESLLSKVEVTWAEGRLDRPRRIGLARRLIGAGFDKHGDPPQQRQRALMAVDRHVDVCLLNQHRSRYARVSEQFDMLWEALHTAHRVYLAAPDMFSATSYAGFVKQLRGLLQDLDKVQNAHELGEDLTRLAVNPLVRSLTNTIISEAGRLKEDLTQHVDEDITERLVNGFITRIAPQFKRSAELAHEEIENALAARDKNRVAAVSGKKAMKRSTGKKTPLRLVK